MIGVSHCLKFGGVSYHSLHPRMFSVKETACRGKVNHMSPEIKISHMFWSLMTIY